MLGFSRQFMSYSSTFHNVNDWRYHLDVKKHGMTLYGWQEDQKVEQMSQFSRSETLHDNVVNWRWLTFSRDVFLRQTLTSHEKNPTLFDVDSTLCAARVITWWIKTFFSNEKNRERKTAVSRISTMLNWSMGKAWVFDIQSMNLNSYCRTSFTVFRCHDKYTMI